ncbi:MAG: ABC transporter ATP-binding protein [Candidatus Odinarchaeota archaeon]|nr:ABC transporter ATP-binding protein [Candidatus Odinarchaeota archaeon]
MSQNDVLLSVRDLVIHFVTYDGIVKALDGVSFDIYRGEVFGLIGETGCGKTVTSLSILGLLPENARIISGKIFFKGENLLENPEKLRGIRGKGISMIFQDPATSLNPLYKVGDQITKVILTHQNVSKEKARKKAINLLKSVGLPDPERIMNFYPFELSGGMQQRVMIAIALSSNPDLLIADEPTSALDVTVQAQILDLLKKIRDERNISILFITHNFGIVAEICDRVGVMYAGTVVEIGSVENILSNPMHPYTKGLLASIPMPGRRQKLAIIRGTIPSLLDPPPGCRFHPRCPNAMDICRKEKPESVEVEDGHFVACHLFRRGM